MKIRAISDIHGNYTALNRVIEDLKEERVSDIVVLGDTVMEGPMPKEVLDSLKELNILAWVRGNTDMWFDEIPKELITSKEMKLQSYVKYALDNLDNDDISCIKNIPFQYSFTAMYNVKRLENRDE